MNNKSIVGWVIAACLALQVSPNALGGWFEDAVQNATKRIGNKAVNEAADTIYDGAKGEVVKPKARTGGEEQVRNRQKETEVQEVQEREAQDAQGVPDEGRHGSVTDESSSDDGESSSKSSRATKSADPDRDVEGSSDHPFFPRINGYKIDRYSEADNAAAIFDAGVNQYKLTGKTFNIKYTQKRSFRKQKGVIEPKDVRQHFIEQITKRNGAVISEKNNMLTGRIVSGGKETWVRHESSNVSTISVFIMDVSDGEQIPVNVVQAPSSKLDDNPLGEHRAYELARRIKLASSEEETLKAVYELLHSLGIGVYTKSGKPIQRGAERSDKDFFLYDFQAKMLARAMFRGSGWPVGDFVSMLENNISLIIPVKGREKFFKVNAQLLQKTLTDRYKLALNAPRDGSNFSTLVIDALARLNTYPTTIDGILNTEWRLLDPVTSFLIMLDVFGGGDESLTGASSGGGIFGWDITLIPAAHADNNLCAMFTGDPEAKKNYGHGLSIANTIMDKGSILPGQVKPLAPLLENVGEKVSPKIIIGTSKVANALSSVSVTADLATIVFWGFSYSISVSAEPGEEHLPHSDNGMHKTIFKFIAKVEFDPGWAEGAAKCGWLVGMDLPEKGAVKDVLLEWSFIPNPAGVLEVPHSTVKTLVGHAGYWTKTGPSGESVFELAAAKRCSQPKGNLEKSKSFLVHVNSRILTSDPWSIFNPFSSGIELIGAAGGGIKSAGTPIKVTWHEQGEDLRGRDYSYQGMFSDQGYTDQEERRENPFSFNKSRLSKPLKRPSFTK